MQRILEPELMDDERQSIAYARADFSGSNQSFVHRVVLESWPGLRSAVDLGCGPGDVVVGLARALPQVAFTAIDGSASMIALAREAVRAVGLDRQITLVQGYVPGVALAEHGFDAVFSKDMLHHLPDPAVLWREVRRLGSPGALVAVMDLVRPSSSEDARRIVNQAAASEDPILQEDFYNSLCAAFTVAEVREQLVQAGLDLSVTRVGDRHMLAVGRLLR